MLPVVDEDSYISLRGPKTIPLNYQTTIDSKKNIRCQDMISANKKTYLMQTT